MPNELDPKHGGMYLVTMDRECSAVIAPYDSVSVSVMIVINVMTLTMELYNKATIIC